MPETFFDWFPVSKEALVEQYLQVDRERDKSGNENGNQADQEKSIM